MEFVIDRSKWRCGDDGAYAHGEGKTCLLNDEGYMCCLGQVGLQLGLSPDEMFMVCGPSYLERYVPLLNEKAGHGYYRTDFAGEAMVINDEKLIDNTTREHLAIAHFASHGHALTFTGEYVKPATADVTA